jgi:DNA-binding transcriptional ArsR family regulator
MSRPRARNFLSSGADTLTKMSTSLPALSIEAMPPLPLEALFGKVRRELLCLLFGEDGRRFFLMELVRRLDAGRGGVQRELARLTGAGLLTRTREGNQIYFQADAGSPFFAHLRRLFGRPVAQADAPAPSRWRPFVRQEDGGRGGLPID